MVLDAQKPISCTAINAEQAVDKQEKRLLRINRLIILLVFIMLFFPPFNVGRISSRISSNLTLLTSATSYGTVTMKLGAFMQGISHAINKSDIVWSMAGCAMVLAGVLLSAAGACLSLGNRKMRRLAVWFPVSGSVLGIAGLAVNYLAYNAVVRFIDSREYAQTARANIEPLFPTFAYIAMGIGLFAILTSSVLLLRTTYKRQSAQIAEMPERYKLFIMFLPVLLLAFLFSYLPIYGWRYAFYDTKAGAELTSDLFVGFKNFTTLIRDPGTRAKIVQVLRNTLVMSGLGISTSWLPIAFAILLAEVRSTKFQRGVQTLTTIPNFLSWVLVYAVALSIFSSDGLINNVSNLIAGSNVSNEDYLANDNLTWIKMLLWGTWKGLGWSSIIYVAGIAGIDQQLYEAARVDGANRFHCIWHITVPGLIPTYMVMLLMSIAGILSNGMEQYLVFSNQYNGDHIQVLDLYVYNLGIGSSQLAVSTVVGILKSVVAVVLLFGANGISKAVRGESII